MKRAILAAAAALAAGLVAGCGPKPGATVSGEVTYDGAAVKKGTITFSPTDGKGKVTGGDVADGRYSVPDVPPGPKTVNVSATADDAGPLSTEDMHTAALDPKLKGKIPASGIISNALIPPNAVGNNEKVDVGAENLTKDFHIKKPGSK